MRRLALGIFTAMGVAIAVPYIASEEGLVLNSYQDIVGKWTVCYGETLGVVPGMQFTKSECDAMLEKRVIEFAIEVDDLTNHTLSPKSLAAWTSFTYNVGVNAFKNSTARKLILERKFTEACDQMLRWNKAGGREVLGLTNRRKREHKLCLEGVNG